MKKVLIFLFLLMTSEVGAVDRVITCNPECLTDVTTPLFEANNIMPGYEQTKIIRIINQKNSGCNLMVTRKNTLTNIDESAFEFIGFGNLGNVESNAIKDIVLGISFKRNSGNEWQNKNIDYVFNFDFECENEIIVNPISGVLINEIYPYPSTGEKEWVEIYNDNDSIVQLNNWKIRDNTLTNVTTFSIQIAAKSLVTIENKNQFFNNTGSDLARLMNNADSLLDSVTYSGAEISKSFSKQPDNSWCYTTASRGVINYRCDGSSPNQTFSLMKFLFGWIWN